MGKLVICPLCKASNDKNRVLSYIIGNRYYCKECYDKQSAVNAEKNRVDQENKRFADEVCKIFGMKGPGPLIYTQRKRLRDEGYTDDEILFTLKYIFDTKKVSKNKATLGLVPYYIADALKKKKGVDKKNDTFVNNLKDWQEPEKIKIDIIRTEEVDNKPKTKDVLLKELEERARNILEDEE